MDRGDFIWKIRSLYIYSKSFVYPYNTLLERLSLIFRLLVEVSIDNLVLVRQATKSCEYFFVVIIFIKMSVEIYF